jgi:hypothetical protein
MDLPNEILFVIYNYCDLKTRARFRKTCRLWRALKSADEESFFYDLSMIRRSLADLAVTCSMNTLDEFYHIEMSQAMQEKLELMDRVAMECDMAAYELEYFNCPTEISKMYSLENIEYGYRDIATKMMELYTIVDEVPGMATFLEHHLSAQTRLQVFAKWKRAELLIKAITNRSQRLNIKFVTSDKRLQFMSKIFTIIDQIYEIGDLVIRAGFE